nr:response regulator [Pseudomonadota bacterium]
RVLVADDNVINRQLARIFLNQLGVAVDEANNGREALEVCASRYYDLILMDIHMPEMDGCEATRHIRARALNGGTPVVALTADVLNRDHGRYRAAGINDYLPKPITELALQQTLAKWCPAYQPATAAPADRS